MNQGEEDASDKPHEPTRKKLEDQRRKGDVPRSTDLITTASYGGLLIAALIFGPEAVTTSGTAMMVLLDRPERLAPLFIEGGGGVSGGFIATIGVAILPIFLVPAACAIAAVFAQNAFVVTPDKLAPKLNRISPLQNAKNKFGRNGLFEFVKSFAKLLIISAVLWAFLRAEVPAILTAALTAPQPAIALLADICLRFLAVVLAVAAAIGGVDYLWQRAEHLRRNRMSHKEVTDETKQSEGDPHLKQKRRQKGIDLATNRMIAEVPRADVIIVNPQHFAVALAWSRAKGAAPVCVAKGVDEIAARIREVAAEAEVPIHRDPPTARALHATVEIGQEVAPTHYKAVAAAIRFADRMRARRRRQT